MNTKPLTQVILNKESIKGASYVLVAIFIFLLFSLDSVANDHRKKITSIRDLRLAYIKASQKYYDLLSDTSYKDWDVIVAEKKAILDRATYRLSWAIKNLSPDSEEYKEASEIQHQVWTDWALAVSQREGRALSQARDYMLYCLEKLNVAMSTTEYIQE